MVLHAETGRSVQASPSFDAVEQGQWVTCTPSGSVAASTAKPWFWLVISTSAGGEVLHRLVGAAMAAIQLVGLAAQRQRQQLVAEADAEQRHAWHRARPGSRGPRTPPVAAGSPGPLDRKTPSGWWRRMSSAVAVAGTTVTRQPAEARQRRMLRFAP